MDIMAEPKRMLTEENNKLKNVKMQIKTETENFSIDIKCLH